MNSAAAPGRPRSAALKLTLVLLGAALFVSFTALGTWQVQRRAWKHALVERVAQRVHAAPVAAPAAGEWPQVTAPTHEYLRVQASGRYLHASRAFVQAATKLGPGFWLLTPLQRLDGSVVLINRGFVPPAYRKAPPALVDDDPVTVTGLLRLSEPRGGFLRENDAAGDRWYSRDVQAIGQASGLPSVAPYFIDAEAPETRPGAVSDAAPVGGLTVITFPDHHAVYALTWYTLALMVAAAAVYVARSDRRLKQGLPSSGSARTHTGDAGG